MPRRSPITASGYVAEGEILYDSPRFREAALTAWEGRRVLETIEDEVATRSIRANRFLFGVVYAIGLQAIYEARQFRMTKDELHALMKERHNPVTIVDPFTGEEKRIGGDTKRMKVERFGDFIEDVMMDLATGYGCSFPEPRSHENWREAA